MENERKKSLSRRWNDLQTVYQWDVLTNWSQISEANTGFDKMMLLLLR